MAVKYINNIIDKNDTRFCEIVELHRFSFHYFFYVRLFFHIFVETLALISLLIISFPVSTDKISPCLNPSALHAQSQRDEHTYRSKYRQR